MLDLFIVVVIAWSIFSGWRSGFVKELASSAGFLVGLFIAATCYSQLGEYLAVKGGTGSMMGAIAAFFLLWVVTPIALGLVANLLTRALKGLHLGWVNSTLGATVSLVKYIILLSCVLSAMAALHILDEERAEESVLFKPMTALFSSAAESAFADDEADEISSDTLSRYSHGDTIWLERDRDFPKPHK